MIDVLRAHLLRQRHAHQADAAGADDRPPASSFSVGDLLQRAKRRDAGAGERRRVGRRQVADVEQMAVARHQHVRRVAALREHADILRLEAEILVAALAHLAFAAAHPRIDQPHVADLHVLRVRPDRDHLADVLVAHGERQLDAAVGEHQLLAAADLVIAVPDVQVGVAHAGREHLQQHLRAGRLRRLGLVHLQRRAALADLKAAHFHWCFLPRACRPGQASASRDP